jgi:hypothetical protein
MKAFTKSLIAAGLIAQLSAFTAQAEQRAKKTETPACSSINLRTAQIGAKCLTFKGALFERVSFNNFGEAWKGPDGLTWSDLLFYMDTQYNAISTCKDLGGTLPSRADFERGEINGFRWVLPNMKDHAFWSSSVNPFVSDFADYFIGNYGSFYSDYRELVGSIRCVRR